MFIGIRMLPCVGPGRSDFLAQPPRRLWVCALAGAGQLRQSHTTRTLVLEPSGVPCYFAFLSDPRMRGQRQSYLPQAACGKYPSRPFSNSPGSDCGYQLAAKIRRAPMFCDRFRTIRGSLRSRRPPDCFMGRQASHLRAFDLYAFCRLML